MIATCEVSRGEDGTADVLPSDVHEVGVVPIGEAQEADPLDAVKGELRGHEGHRLVGIGNEESVEVHEWR